MLLAGVAVTALSGAVIGLLTYLADDQMLRNLSLWQMGSLAAGKPVDVALALLTLVALLILFLRDANPLNALLLGEGEARHLGIQVQSLKRRLILLTAAGVGVAVAVAGMIGFVGLVVPHLVRLLAGPNHVRLLPLSALLGAALLLGADMLARTCWRRPRCRSASSPPCWAPPSSSGCWSRAAGRFNRRTPLVCFIDPAALSPAQPQPGHRPILDRLDLSMQAGSLTALLGPNGAGKSSLLKCLTGELEHQGRSACLAGSGRSGPAPSWPIGSGCCRRARP